MFDALKALFASSQSQAPDEEQTLRTAVAAILVELAYRDGVYEPSERAAIDTMLAEAYDLNAQEASALRALGETAQADAIDTHRFTRAIKDSLSVEERVELFERVWMVALSDGQRDHREDGFLRKLAGLLYVPDQQSGLARKRAEARLAAAGTSDGAPSEE